MKSILKLILSTCFLVAVHAGFAQVDTLKKFLPKENSPADQKLKDEIRQKQLLEKPIPLKDKTANKESFKRKTIMKKYRQKLSITSK